MSLRHCPRCNFPCLFPRVGLINAFIAMITLEGVGVPIYVCYVYQLKTNSGAEEQTRKRTSDRCRRSPSLHPFFFFPRHLLETLVLTTLVLINVLHKTKIAKEEEAYLLRSTTIW